MLRVESLKKRMPGFELMAEFQVCDSERIAITGRSGIGKTTLLRMLAGLEPLSRKTDSGRILIDGRDVTRLPPQERQIGFVFQEQALFSGRTAFQNIAFGLRVRGVSADEQDKRVSEWLEKIGLFSRGGEIVDHLSGGERQRVALARALITRPRLLLLDEPFVGLDTALRSSLYDELVKLHAENPVPLLFVSHDPEDLERLGTGKLCLEESSDGRIRRAFLA